jgi:hypothetical protein
MTISFYSFSFFDFTSALNSLVSRGDHQNVRRF